MLAENFLPAGRKVPRHVNERVLHVGGAVVRVEGPVRPDVLKKLRLHEDMNTFREPAKQHAALVEIAALEQGRIYVARVGELVVGYVTFHPPDIYERWGQTGLNNLIELGAIEVTPRWRGKGLSTALLEQAFSGSWVEEKIIFATEYYWHWDLKGTGLTVWQYRNLMENLFRKVGLEPCNTDDPEICSHAANMLMVRVGKKVCREDILEFERVRMRGFSVI